MQPTSTAFSIVLGCLVAVVSSAIQSLGITLQRKSHLLPYNDENHLRLHQQKRHMWLAGFLMFIVANILGSIVQISTLPLIILLPLQSIGLIFNSILSCMLLPGERFTKKLGWGTAVIALGAFFIAYNGNSVPPQLPDEDSNRKFQHILRKLLLPRFLGWFLFTYVLIAVLLFVNWILSKRREVLKSRPRPSRYTYKLLDRYQFIRGINYGLISGTLTAHTFLFAKSLIDVVVETILNDTRDIGHLFTSANFTPYFLLLIMLSIVGCQVTAFNLGLSQILTSILYPLCFLVYNLFNLINDVTFNLLLSDNIMTVGQLLLVVVGLCGVLFGVVLISWDSAFGETKKTSFRNTEDENIMQLKFPYWDEPSKPLLQHNNGSLRSLGDDAIYMAGLADSLSSKYGTLVDHGGDSKRAMSYEETQIFLLFG